MSCLRYVEREKSVVKQLCFFYRLWDIHRTYLLESDASNITYWRSNNDQSDIFRQAEPAGK